MTYQVVRRMLTKDTRVTPLVTKQAAGQETFVVISSLVAQRTKSQRCQQYENVCQEVILLAVDLIFGY
jgi:hypothetical protein